MENPSRILRVTFSEMKDWMLYILVLTAAAISLLANLYERFPGDISVVLWVRGSQAPITTTIMDVASWVGSGWLLFGLVGVVAIVLFLKRRRRECFFVVGVIVMMSLSPILKMLVDRPRPPVELTGVAEHLGGLGFPSGHAYQSLIVFGLLTLLAGILVRRVWLRRLLQLSLVFLILAIGLSRVYLGVHWPSDIIGAYLLGGSVLVLLIRVYRAKVVVQAS